MEQGEDVLYANRKYVVLHAAASGEKCIHLPVTASAYEVYEGKYYSQNSREIRMALLKGQTKMFRLDESLPEK